MIGMEEIKGLIFSSQQMFYVAMKLVFLVPTLIFDFYVMIIKSVLSLFQYNLFTIPKKPFHNEVALIVGFDNPLGRSFSSQIMKLNGTVVCLDSNKERGDVFVKALNDTENKVRAFFYECDVRDKASLHAAIEKVTKDVGDVSILLNCSQESVVSTYYDVYQQLFPIMKANKRGTLVFIRACSDQATRNAILALHKNITKEIKTSKTSTVSTVLAHIYPKITYEDDSGLFGSETPDFVAFKILEGIASNHSNIYMPEFMMYLAFWTQFLPQTLLDRIDNTLFHENKKKVL